MKITPVQNELIIVLVFHFLPLLLLMMVGSANDDFTALLSIDSLHSKLSAEIGRPIRTFITTRFSVLCVTPCTIFHRAKHVKTPGFYEL